MEVSCRTWEDDYECRVIKSVGDDDMACLKVFHGLLWNVAIQLRLNTSFVSSS